jgi:hypothetical protein
MLIPVVGKRPKGVGRKAQIGVMAREFMADLRSYQEAAPANLECDVADRATADFQPKLFRVSVDRCLLRVARATAVQEQSCAAVEEGEFTDIIVPVGPGSQGVDSFHDRIAYKPISTYPRQAECIAGFASWGHEATNGDVSLQARVRARVYLR